MVPFTFNDRKAAQKALARFTANHVFEITTPAFDSKARSEFNGCPVKTVLLLTQPTTIKAVPPTNTDMLEHPATGLTVSMDISQVLHVLKGSGSAKQLSKTFNFCGKFLSASPPKPVRRLGCAAWCRKPSLLTQKVAKW